MTIRGARRGEYLDLWGVVAAVGITALAVFAPVLSATPLRVVVGLSFVLFVPGYAFVAALFPEHATGADTSGEDARGIDGLERLVLSFGSSIAIVPLVGLVLNFTPWGITLVPVFLSLAGLTLVLTGIGFARRRQVEPTRRFHVPTARLDDVRQEFLEPTDRTDAILNVVLVLSVLLAASSVAYAVAAPTQGEDFTEFHLLTQNESGTLVADDYPTNFTEGESRSLVVGVTNQEHERTNYTVVVELQRVNVTDGDVHVRQMDRLHQYQITLQPGETWQKRNTITPEMVGDHLRLQYLLYRGDAPSNPKSESAYRQLHLWITVMDDNQTATRRVPEPP